jgi:plasmid stabilization system protein ParE
MAKRPVRLSPKADADIDRLVAFIARDSPATAQRARERLIYGLRLLAALPFIGFPVQGSIRQLVLPFGKNAYILRYRVTKSEVVINRIWHSKERRR